MDALLHQTINANAYRADGQRISKIENGTRTNYIYHAGTVLYTTDASNDLINFHLNTPDGSPISVLHNRHESNPFSNMTTDLRRSVSTVLGELWLRHNGSRAWEEPIHPLDNLIRWEYLCMRALALQLA